MEWLVTCSSDQLQPPEVCSGLEALSRFGQSVIESRLVYDVHFLAGDIEENQLLSQRIPPDVDIVSPQLQATLGQERKYLIRSLHPVPA
jgi:hypothetical protein